MKACAPYRARTKGKDERGVGDVKRNAIAGWSFDSFEALEAHLERWSRDIADQRVHGTTDEAPAARFARDEASALRPLPSCGPFVATRELSRRVSADCAVEVDTNAYSVPWRLIGERVRVLVAADTVSVTTLASRWPSTGAAPAAAAASSTAPTSSASPGLAGPYAARRRLTRRRLRRAPAARRCCAQWPITKH